MKTTQLFVELVVIGFGGLVWLALFYLVCVGSVPPTLLRGDGSWAALMPVLSLVYVLGIVIDRGADKLFDPWDQKHRSGSFSEVADYYGARRVMVVHGPELWNHLEYGRSRLRICRGWALNSFLILLSADLATCRVGFLSPWQIVFMNASLLALLVACVFSWQSLNKAEYAKIERQAPWIRSVQDMENKKNG